MGSHGLTWVYTQFDHFSFSDWRIFILIIAEQKFTYWRHINECQHFYHTASVEKKETELKLYANGHFIEAKCSKFCCFVSYFEIDLAIKRRRSLFRHFKHELFFSSNNIGIHYSLISLKNHCHHVNQFRCRRWLQFFFFHSTEFNNQMKLRRILWQKEYPSLIFLFQLCF